MKNILYIFIFLFTVLNIKAQDILLFKPLTAYIFEPRIGAAYNFNDENLRLDIGTSLDLARTSIDSSELSFGADFFTFSRLRSQKNFTFPVETSDYYFGINFAAKSDILGTDLTARLRSAHISSHLVDGYSANGVFLKKPYVYSREFVELVIAKEYAIIDNFNSRLYIGSTYIFSTAPDDINNFVPRIGAELNYKLTNWLDYDFGLDISKGEGYTNVSVQTGFNLRLMKKMGIFAGYYNYSGSSMHGMFYKEKVNYGAIGFQIIYY
jgi:hypothetical protein